MSTIVMTNQTTKSTQTTFTPKKQNVYSSRGRKKIPRNVNYTPTLTIWKPSDWPSNDGNVMLGHDELEALRLKWLNHLGVISAAKQMWVSKSLFAKIYNEAVSKVSNALIYGKSLHIELRENGDFAEPLL